MDIKFYLCETCGNVIYKAVDSGVLVECCGDQMIELIPKVSEAGTEKHLPVVTKVDDCTIKVEVGAVPHPMTAEHHISFIYLETQDGGQFVQLNPTGAPEAVFCACKSKPIAVYAYCNIHGLWKIALS